MRDERGNIFSFDLFFSSTSENARTHKRSLDTRETKSRKLIQNRRERKKNSAQTSVPSVVQRTSKKE